MAQSLNLSGPVEDGPPRSFSFGATDAGSADTLSFTILSSPSEGVVANNANGTFTFDPGSAFQDLRQGETRAVSFTYRASDDDGANSAPATVIINVAGVGSERRRSPIRSISIRGRPKYRSTTTPTARVAHRQL